MAHADGALLRRQPRSAPCILAEIQELGYYFGDLSDRGQIAQALINQDDGTFLVRKKLSAKHEGVLSLSVKFLVPGAKTDIWHLNIVCDAEKVYLSHDPSLRFDSFASLVRYYRRHSIAVAGGSSPGIYLRSHLSAAAAASQQRLLLESKQQQQLPPHRPPVPQPRTKAPRDGRELSRRQASIVLRRHMSRMHAIGGLHRDACPLVAAAAAASAAADDYRAEPLLVPPRGGESDGNEDECVGGAAERCECGISFEDAQLPSGWTMHLSHEPDTRGFLFFKDPSGVATWTLPACVVDQMSEIEERQLLRRLAATSPSGLCGQLP